MVVEKKFEFDSAGIEILKISSASADLQIDLVEDGNVIAYVEVDSNDYVPEAESSGKRLSIKFQKGTNINIPFIKNLFDGGAEVKSVRLLVPKSVRELDANSASGDIVITDFDLRSLKISNVSGDVKIENCSVENLNFSTVSGDLNFIASNYRRGKFGSVSGDLSIKGLPPMERETIVSSVSGDAIVSYSGEPKFDATISSVSGDISSDVGLVKIDKKHYRSGNGESQEYLKMNSVSGDLIISTKYTGTPAKEVKVESRTVSSEEKKGHRSAVVEENLQDQETRKILLLFKEGKLTKEYTFEMLGILGYSEQEIEEMLEVDEELQKFKDSVDVVIKNEDVESEKSLEAIEKPETPEKPDTPEEPKSI
jgi:DUF4097 and DUF4098 domain-containing protein YvlB